MTSERLPVGRSDLRRGHRDPERGAARRRRDGASLTPFDFGWVYLNLQHTDVHAGLRDRMPRPWVTTVMDARVASASASTAIQLDNANTPNTTIIPVP